MIESIKISVIGKKSSQKVMEIFSENETRLWLSKKAKGKQSRRFAETR